MVHRHKNQYLLLSTRYFQKKINKEKNTHIAPYTMEEAARVAYVSQFGFSCIWNSLSGQNSSDGLVPPSPTTFLLLSLIRLLP